MIKMVLRMMTRMELIMDGTVGVRKDGKWNGALDSGETEDEDCIDKWMEIVD